jgi:hypothetical protein
MSSTLSRRVARCLEDQAPDAALDRLYRDGIHQVGHALHDDAAMLLISRPADGG